MPVNLDSKKQRSYGGCSRCKQRRQKCDEQKPRCGRCTAAGVSCDYAVRLRWGGRTFDRSRFGDCLKGDVRKLENTADGFVYAAPAPLSLPASESMLQVLPTEIQLLPSLSPTGRALLHHFTHEASRITCSAHVQKELCQLILPMALESPSLMNATLAWAAIHSVAFRGSIEYVSDPDRLIAGLRAKSIEHLRLELQDPGMTNKAALLATVRTLCQFEIHSGSDGSSAWRVHVKGAKALMAAIEGSQSLQHDTQPPPRLLYRWYASLDSLAALTAGGRYLEGDETASNGFIEEESSETAYLDDYNGYSTDLSFLIGKIGAAAGAWRHNNAPGSSKDMETQASLLESCVNRIMERDNSSQPVFYPGVAEKLSPQAILEYSLCNQAYQHTALIHIHRRLRNLPANTPQIQHSVKVIIECVSGITPSNGLSPAIVMTTPLFTAGCEAIGEDRDAIRVLLIQLYDMLKIRNIKLTLQFLETFWSNDTIAGGWENLLRQNNWDFIPY